MFAESHAVIGAVSKVIAVDLHIRGCPPRPVQLLEGLLRLMEPINAGAARKLGGSVAANDA
jgi:NADH:ubiquinone oxidoreductase subunit B-like Fe-S oxidoreductase